MDDVKDAIAYYKSLCKFPNIVKANLKNRQNDEYFVDALWKQRNLKRNKNITFRTSQEFNHSRLELGDNLGFPTECNADQIEACFKDKKAIIRDEKVTEKKEQFLEIWNSHGNEITVNLNEKTVHGKVHFDIQFGALEWNENGSKLLYIAEKKIPKSKSFFATSKKDDNAKPGEEHVHRFNWGEQLTECYNPTVCVYDSEDCSFTAFDDVLPTEYSYGQAVWLNSDEIVVAGWKHDPFPLGLIYCSSRKSALFKLNVATKSVERLTDKENHFASPRINSKGQLVYLETPSHGPHMNCAKLMMLDLTNWSPGTKAKVVVDAVNHTSEKLKNFPGLFLHKLPQRCFTNDGDSVILSSDWRSHLVVLKINIQTGDVKNLTTEGNWIVTDVMDNFIVTAFSTPSQPEHIRIGKLNGDAITWSATKKNEIEDIEWSVHSIKPELTNEKYPDIDYECILFKPKNFAEQKLKHLIVNPHGGPHSCCKALFTLSASCLCKLGFALVQVNYRGSTGFGKDSIYSLPGRVGTQDVADVQQAAVKFKNELGCDKVFVTGGSHGGFLTVSLISRYRDFYSAAISRNPVLNFPSMEGCTDIPDWVVVETMNEEFDFKFVPNAEFYASAKEKSAYHLVDKAKTPCMLQLGEVDMRVPISQGLQWAQKYRAFGGECKVLMYKDNCHPLNKVDAEADGFINMIKWIYDHSN